MEFVKPINLTYSYTLSDHIEKLRQAVLLEKYERVL